MNEFNYLDIYASKGAEYLWVIGYLIAFVAFALMLSRWLSHRRVDRGDDAPRRDEGPHTGDRGPGEEPR